MKLSLSRRVRGWFKALIHSRRFTQSWMGKSLSMIQLMELDACTHCAMCTSRCSVAIAFEGIPNINILPSEKLASIKALASGRPLEEREIRDLQEGVYLCTNCYRCTVVCPVGIDLQNLWIKVRELLLQRGIPELSVLSPLSFYRGLMKDETALGDYEKPLTQAREAIASQCDLLRNKDKILPLTSANRRLQDGLNLSAQAKNLFGLLRLPDLYHGMPCRGQLRTSSGSSGAPSSPNHAGGRIGVEGSGLWFQYALGLPHLLSMPGAVSPGCLGHRCAL